MQITVESAIELTAEHRSSLESKLKDTVGKNISVIYSINPDIIGGLRISTPSKIVDLSLASKLSQLNQSLIKN